MKSKLRILTSATLLCGLAAATYLLAEPAIERWQAKTEANEKNSPSLSNLQQVLAANVVVDPSGSQQLLSAIARLEQRGSISARLREQAYVADLPFSGAGTYLQQGRGTKRHVRWLLQSQHEGVQATLLQISDGRFLWTDRHLASGRTIDRVDLWQLRRQAKLNAKEPGLTAGAQGKSAPFSPLLGRSFGGLPMLLESLVEHFEFTAPRPFRYRNQQVFGLVGRWRQESLSGIIAHPAPASEGQALAAADLRKALQEYLAEQALPDRIPHHVLVILGQNDLFPYLIDYRSISDPLADASLSSDALYQLSTEPLARLEFYDVAFDQPIDTSEFNYTPPADPEWLDGTAAYVQRLQRLREVQVALAQERRLATAPVGANR